ncbi:ecto-ADP-ribosyltransferase 5-like [Bufo gargarizans]|uniref:ecto-ADP-ribosyltransferase 5-like n=1 Tax=Bufo gargarizans TaxID=30331 RepID=UPI001CF4F114|nr:ecto-ADP-ribosyltransferase 5-like [Bufo gargarizans]
MSRPRLPLFCLGLFVLKSLQVFCIIYDLEMFEGSFDDQYIGCTEKMESIAPGLLRKERMKTRDLNVSWNIASDLWKKEKHLLGRLPDGFKDEYGIALIVFSVQNFSVSKLLDRDIQIYSKNPKTFRFHSLHFYITRAFNLLQPGCDGKPLYTQRSFPELLFKPPSDPQAPVRLGLYINTLTNIGLEENRSITLSFITCFGAKLLNFSYLLRNDIVIVPGNEVFQVTDYNEEKRNTTLQSTHKKCSYYNCAYLGGTKNQNCTYYPPSSSSSSESRPAVRYLPPLGVYHTK